MSSCSSLPGVCDVVGSEAPGPRAGHGLELLAPLSDRFALLGRLQRIGFCRRAMDPKANFHKSNLVVARALSSSSMLPQPRACLWFVTDWLEWFRVSLCQPLAFCSCGSHNVVHEQGAHLRPCSSGKTGRGLLKLVSSM